MGCDSETDDSSLCERVNDEKFIPLVIKHKRIFKDVGDKWLAITKQNFHVTAGCGSLK